MISRSSGNEDKFWQYHVILNSRICETNLSSSPVETVIKTNADNDVGIGDALLNTPIFTDGEYFYENLHISRNIEQIDTEDDLLDTDINRHIVMRNISGQGTSFTHVHNQYKKCWLNEKEIDKFTKVIENYRFSINIVIVEKLAYLVCVCDFSMNLVNTLLGLDNVKSTVMFLPSNYDGIDYSAFFGSQTRNNLVM